MKVEAVRSTDSFGNHLQHSRVPEPRKSQYDSSLKVVLFRTTLELFYLGQF